MYLVGFPALHLRRIGHVDQCHGAIELGTDLEHTDHVQALHARCDPARRAADFRHDQGQLVADIQAKTPGRDLADHHAELAGLQVIQAALDNMIGNNGHLAFARRIDTADLDRLHRALIGNHPLHFGEGHRREHLRVFQGGSGNRLPVIQWLDPQNGRVGHHAEDARTHLALEAVHHRQHHDHGQHAQREADHRGHGDERNKMVAALGTCVARTYEDG
ncbi:hypothetical protein D9M71_254630 [compost metagenome]